MPRFFKFLVFVLLVFVFSVIISPKIVVAQNASPSSPATQNNPIQNFIDSILSFINPQFQNYDQAHTPGQLNTTNSATNVTNSNVKGVTTDTKTENSFYYAVGRASNSPGGQATTDLNSWLSNFAKNIQDAFSNTSEDSRAFVNVWVPPDAAKNYESKDKSFLAAQCAGLPPPCDPNKGVWVGAPNNLTPTPTGPGGNLTPTPTGSLPSQIVYYSQCDPNWSAYGTNPPTICGAQPPPPAPPIYMNIGDAGCGPTSSAMVLATILHDTSNYTPDKVWDKFLNNGYMNCTDSGGNTIGSHGGSSLVSVSSILQTEFQNRGINATVGIRSFPGNQMLIRGDLMNTINAGDYVITTTDQYGGHFVVVSNITKDLLGNFTVFVDDPYSNCTANPISGVSVLPNSVNFIYGYVYVKLNS